MTIWFWIVLGVLLYLFVGVVECGWNILRPDGREMFLEIYKQEIDAIGLFGTYLVTTLFFSVLWPFFPLVNWIKTRQ